MIPNPTEATMMHSNWNMLCWLDAEGRRLKDPLAADRAVKGAE